MYQYIQLNITQPEKKKRRNLAVSDDMDKPRSYYAK